MTVQTQYLVPYDPYLTNQPLHVAGWNLLPAFPVITLTVALVTLCYVTSHH